jgi:hypothetical protein
VQHLVGGRFGYNSEKQFNNSLFLEILQRREMAAMNNKVLKPVQGGAKPKLTVCLSLFFGLNAARM